jgi:hypothetical protein
MKKLIIIACTILILAAAFQAATMVSAAQNDGRTPVSSLSAENGRDGPSSQQFSIAATGMNLSGAWDILLFYNDGGMDREIWYLTQEGTTITGHSRYVTDSGDFIRNRMTGIINGSYLTMSIKSGQDYVTEFKARIADNGTTMGTQGTAPDGTSFPQTLRNINEGHTSNLLNRQDRWINLNGQWWGQKRPNQSSMEQPGLQQSSLEQESAQYGQSGQYQENYQQSYYSPDLDLSGAWDILLFYDNGGVNREIWYVTQTGSLLTGHTRYRTDDGNVVRSRLTGRLNGSNLTMSLKSGDYTTQFQARISDNGLSMGTKKSAPNGASFYQTMRNIDSGRTITEMTVPNRYQNGDWWGKKRMEQTSR